MKSEAKNKTRTLDAVVTRDARLCGVTGAAVNTHPLVPRVDSDCRRYG